MKKLILILLTFLIPFKVIALALPDVLSSNVLIYDITDDKYLYDVGSSEVRTVASLTKILTVITSIENVDELNQKVTITSDMLTKVPWDAYIIGIKEGEVYTLKELMIGTINRSGADAALAVALTTSKDLKTFVELMNKTAKKIGMKDSVFSNPIGMDGNNFSTAKDINKLLLYALKNEKFKEIFNTPNYEFGSDKKVNFSSSRDKLNAKLLEGAKIVGYKTGYTASAGNCFAVYFISNSHEYTMITLNATQTAENKSPNMTDAVNLINFLTEGYDVRVLLSSGEIVKSVKVNEANIERYDITLDYDVSNYLGKDFDRSLLNVKYEGKNELTVKDKIGDKIGVLKVYYGDKMLYEQDCILNVKLKYTINQFIKHYKIMYILIFIFSCYVFKKIFITKK